MSPSNSCDRSLSASSLRSRSGSPSVCSMIIVYERLATCSITAPLSSEKYGTASSGTARAIMPVRPRRRFRAVRFGR